MVSFLVCLFDWTTRESFCCPCGKPGQYWWRWWLRNIPACTTLSTDSILRCALFWDFNWFRPVWQFWFQFCRTILSKGSFLSESSIKLKNMQNHYPCRVVILHGQRGESKQEGIRVHATHYEIYVSKYLLVWKKTRANSGNIWNNVF